MLKQNNLSDILCLRTTKGKGGKEMLTMSQINDIRDLSQKGYSISKISSLTGLDRKTVRKYLNQDDFSPQPPVAKRRTSIVTPYLDIIEEWLSDQRDRESGSKCVTTGSICVPCKKVWKFKKRAFRLFVFLLECNRVEKTKVRKLEPPGTLIWPLCLSPIWSEKFWNKLSFTWKDNV